MKDDPFKAPAEASTISRKRARALEIKRLLREAEEHNLCYIGDVTVDRLKIEQYSLAREL